MLDQNNGHPPQPAESIIARTIWRASEPKYRKEQIIYSQGDPAVFVFYVRAGKVKVAIFSEGGREAVIAIHSPGDFFGEKCLIGHPLRMSTATALTACELVQMPKSDVIRALHDDLEFSEPFANYLMERNIRMQGDIVDQLLNSTERRLARLLLILANYGEENRSDAIVPNISQETLAKMIGATRTRVNFFMNKFRRLGFIEYDRDIKVNRSLNRILHEDPQITQRD